MIIHVKLESAQLALISSNRTDILAYGAADVSSTPDGYLVTERPSPGDSRPMCGLDVPNNSVVDVQSEFGGLVVRRFQGTLRARLRDAPAKVESASGRLRIATTYGSITVERTRGSLDVLTSSGNLTVRRHSGELQLVTDSGQMTLDDIEGPVAARSTTGSINAVELKSTTRISTRTGAVSINGMRGQLTVRSQSGDLALDASVIAHTTLETQKGRVDVRLGSQTDARIEASARQGVVRSERIDLAPGSSRRTVRARLRDGRARLQLSTGMGVVEVIGPIRKSPAPEEVPDAGTFDFETQAAKPY